MQKKYEQKQEYADTNTRDPFTKITTSNVQISAGMSMYGDRIKVIDKNNKHAD